MGRTVSNRRHFLDTIRDLEQCANSPREYDVVRSSALVRRLFLDGGRSLFDLVNKEYRAPLIFDVVETGELPFEVDVRFALAPGFEIPNAPGRVTKQRDAFFKMQVGKIKGERFTVYELVNYTCYVLGGVHISHPSGVTQISLDEIDRRLEINGMKTSVTFFRNLDAIVLNAVNPLVERVR
jgi:hypothetical protein